MNKKLWTGKTARQELISVVTNKALASGWTVADSLEFAFEGVDYVESGSIKCETYRYWLCLSDEGQSRLFATMKNLVVKADRQSGRNFKR